MRLPISKSTLVLSLVMVSAVVSTHWVRLNLSSSMPYGLYRLKPVPALLTHGLLVIVPVPDSVSPWHTAWVPLLKTISGLPGDTVCHHEHILYVNSVDFGPLYNEAHGHLLPHIGEGCFVVPVERVFLANPTKKSLDGRYFGLTPIASLTAQAVPLLTWR